MQSVAQSWLVYRLTGSAVLLGWVGFANQIPVFLLAPVGGAVADHHNRRRIVSGSCDQTVRVWDAMTGQATQTDNTRSSLFMVAPPES